MSEAGSVQPVETSASDARDAIAALQEHQAWAIIRRSTRAGDRDTVGLVGGRRSVVDSVLDVPLETGPPAAGHIADRLLAIPFRQVAERGFEAHDDGTPLVVVDVETELEFTVAEVVEAIDDTGVEFADRGGFETDDEEYGKLVEAIITDEIGQGEGANLVIGRHYRATVADWGADKALTVFRRLLERERGAYWTFLFFTGDRYLIGASPERHVTMHGGDVRMNPISGTFRIRPAPRATGDLKARSSSTSSHDEKEIYELFMVVDEELKMMCDICTRGRPGARAVPQADEPPRPHRVPPRRPHHPRPARGAARHDVRRHGHRLAGRERLPADQAVRDRGPRLLRRRAGHPRPRRRGRAGRRQPDRDPHRRRRPRRAGSPSRPARRWCATPTPAYEVAETHAKAGGILSAFGLVAARAGPGRQRGRAGQRRGRAARAQRPQPPALARSGSPTRPARRPTRGCAASTSWCSTARTTSSTCCATCSACSG